MPSETNELHRMESDPNNNPLWDTLLGDRTDYGTLRLLLLIVLFIVIGGGIFSLI